jgi:indolepyruvate ferredoxin oxidoreductase beta subunit
MPALDMAQKCGSSKAVNVVMIGVLAKYTGIDKEIWIDAIRKTVKPQFIEMNIKAFEAGFNYNVAE